MFEKTIYHIIKVKPKLGGESIEVIKWEDLPYNVALKWHWYFEYRAALLKVKYPMYFVDHRWGHMDPSEQQAERIQRNKHIALKGKITKVTNKIIQLDTDLEAMKQNWSQIFPVEDDPVFIGMSSKLNKYQIDLMQMKEYYDERERLLTNPD